MTGMALLILVLFPSTPAAFDLPDYDPWYYRSNKQGYLFTIPDKAQHFYGSALLNEVGKRLPLPERNLTSPILAFAAGFMYEVWQERRGIGFSHRDLVANVLGVATSQFSSQSLKMWLDYSTTEKIITFNVSIAFPA